MLRSCIIGTGRIASTLEKDPLRPAGCTHAGTYDASEEVRLVSGADTDDEALTLFGEDWNISKEHLYLDYRDLLQKERIDIASICAYAPQRKEMALAALECGIKGLWLEKALGCSIAEGEAIQAALENHKATAVVDYPRRARAHFRKIKELIENQTYGRLESVTCHMTHQLIHTGTHAFDILRYWCGEALSVSGKLEHGCDSSNEIRDQGGQATIQFSSGTVGFVSAYRKKYYIFQFDLIFEKARILVGNDIEKVYLPDASKLYTGFRELFEQPSYEWGSYYSRGMLAELTHSMRTGEVPLYSVPNAIEALRIALAIFASHLEGGKAIAPHEVDPRLKIESH
ncbi:Gfo/Idh/MocA family oxidoreductase [Pelagicoccus sp. SDUM812002]|uniref:Gfo/Idh/MocA family protein n=1 Tax=Pelagicoccus sp. SDUM812002 TaxID=3041266 RepID=UPI0028105562|nr:Gfo/Idh/MocA family oxidoreductase [Pelagicoccus sp. SDUM812002]MDQ8187127.1 Gfo/Idh/MocA family oxidoreductase [Pelagicoccus sp. SDUM812002]